jgi:hypothetical protein
MWNNPNGPTPKEEHMKRRNFVQSLLVVPAAAVAAQQPAPPPTAAGPSPAPAPASAQTPAPVPRPARFQNVPKFDLAQPDNAAEIVTGFFSPPQFAALNKLAAVLVPPIKGNPGAIDAHAPEFLDFLISQSPAPQQQLYRQGLDGLNSASHKHFHKPFAELDAQQADTIIRPLLVARPWEKTLPSDPMQHFIAQAHDDLRTATMNSAEWAASPSASRRGRFNQGRRQYWKPIDPRVGV